MAALFLLTLLVVLPAYILGVLGMTFSISGYRHRTGTLLCGLPILGLGLLGAWGVAQEALLAGPGPDASGWAWRVGIVSSMLLAGGLVVGRWWRRGDSVTPPDL